MKKVFPSKYLIFFGIWREQWRFFKIIHIIYYTFSNSVPKRLTTKKRRKKSCKLKLNLSLLRCSENYIFHCTKVYNNFPFFFFLLILQLTTTQNSQDDKLIFQMKRRLQRKADFFLLIFNSWKGWNYKKRTQKHLSEWKILLKFVIKQK